MRNKSLLKSRRFRCGSLAAAITVFFVAIVIVFNAIYGALASRFGWYVDMTGEKVFTLSDVGREFVSDLRTDVDIYFASLEDALLADSDMRYIYETARQLEAESSYIHVHCHDVVKEKGVFEEFYSTKNTDITSTSVVVASGGESVVLASAAFFVYNEQGTRWAYNGEYRLISSLLQVTRTDTPVVYFTKGHGEDLEGAAALANLFSDNGFDVRDIDLKSENIDADGRIVVIYDPIYDFFGIDAEDKSSNEIDKIDAFVDGLGGLLVFESPEHSGNLNNLNEFLEEWGISYASGTYVKSPEHSMTPDGMSIVTEYTPSNTLGGSFYREIADMDNPPSSVIREACPINILWDSRSGSGGTRRVGAMLSSFEGSTLCGTDGVTIDGEDENSSYRKNGVYDVAVMSYETKTIDNDFYYSYVMASTPSLASNNYLISNAYGNSDVIYSVWKFVGRERILADIELKQFDDTTLTVTTAESNSYTVKMTLILPLIIGAAGVFVLVRRKNS